VATTGGFAPGVIYYHFADLDELFVAAARFTSEARLARYRAETEGITGAVELVRRLRALYAEDGAEGHIAAVQELIAAANTSPRLAEEVRASTAVWTDFAAGTIQRLIGDTPFAALVPVRELATAAVAGYLGIEMLSHLDANRTSPTDMFDAAERTAAMFDALRP
jgi:AcrR family transcriptional regulator